MDVLTLLEDARRVGLTVLVEGDRLVVRGPRSAEALARQILARKAELVSLLRPLPTGTTAGEAPIRGFGAGDRPSAERCPGCAEGDFTRPRPRGTWCCARCHPYEGMPASEIEWWPRVGIAVAFEAGGSAAGEPCRCCGGAARWRLRSGGPWVCSTCHPPLPPAELIETEAGR